MYDVFYHKSFPMFLSAGALLFNPIVGVSTCTVGALIPKHNVFDATPTER